MSGAYILPETEGGESSVLPDSPAAKAGLKAGDVITRVAGKPINETNSLTSLLGAFQPGQKIELTISRDGKNQKISITLGTTESN
jgi:S1-C subfamily serine protease